MTLESLKPFDMGSVIKKMHLNIVFQDSLAKVAVLQVKKNDTITVKKRNYTDYGSFKQVGCLSGKSKIGFQLTSKYVPHLSRPSES